jgi:hypothetical protein
VVISLKFDLVAEVLPEDNRFAPIVPLDEDTVDALSLNASSAFAAARRDRRAAPRPIIVTLTAIELMEEGHQSSQQQLAERAGRLLGRGKTMSDPALQRNKDG